MNAGELEQTAGTAPGRGRLRALPGAEDGPGPRQVPAPAEAAWLAAWAEGRRSHPGIHVSYADFRSPTSTAAPPTAVGDYYLARALEAGLPGAWEHLQREYRRRLHGFLRRRGARRAEADQILDEAWGAFATPPPSGCARTSMGTYDGRGPLHAWMATVLWRRLADRWRARAADERAALPGPEPAPYARDPLERVVDAEAEASLGEALDEAWGELTPRELEAVVLRYRCRLPQTEIARVLRVGAPRVTRLLQSAIGRLRDAVSARLGAPPGTQAALEDLSGLAVTLERVLARSAAAVEEPARGRAVHG